MAPEACPRRTQLSQESATLPPPLIFASAERRFYPSSTTPAFYSRSALPNSGSDPSSTRVETREARFARVSDRRSLLFLHAAHLGVEVRGDCAWALIPWEVLEAPSLFPERALCPALEEIFAMCKYVRATW